jgi:hypothetical protein
MIIDFHCHIGVDSSGDDFEKVNFKDLKKSMDKWKIDKVVAFPFNRDDRGLIKESLAILEKSKEVDWIIPFLRINPKTTSKEEFIELINKGFKGLKLHPDSQDFHVDNKEYFWIYELCGERKIPILFHSSVKNRFSHPIKILNVVKKFPKLTVIMAHFFGNDFSIMKIAKNYPNLYVDTSVNSGTLNRLWAVEKYGFKRFVFGSDSPYDSQGVSLLKITEAGLKKEDEEMILHGNAEEILKLF